jgi:BMFP domain-containing protein YqiC
MTKLFWNILKLSPVVVATLFTANSALAGEVSVSQLSQAGNADIAQGTSVSRLSDVQPTDWAFQALQSLVERYNCIVGYPNNTYRGNRALSRYEFAAGLNACLNQVNELIATSTADLVNKQDLATLQRLQEEFRSELATLRGRVDALEARTTFLENHQFSTTTKLQGEAIFSLDEAFGSGTKALPSGSTAARTAVTNNAVFSDRVRLNLITSFTGTDRLQTRLAASNTLNNANPGTPTSTNNGTGTNMTRLGIDGGLSSGNSVVLDKLNYAYTLGDKARIKIDATGAELFENANTFSPDFNPSGTGALSRYGRFSPIYRSSGDSSSGITLTVNPNGPVAFTAAYIAEGLNGRTLPNSPTTGAGGQGVFNGDNTLFGQLEFKPNKAVALGLTYTHNYQEALSGLNANLFSGTGSSFANSPFGTGVATEANNYGVEVSFQPTAKLVLGGWGGYTAASTLDHTQRSADIWYWAATLAVKDFGKQGNTLGFIFGQPPKVTSFNSGTYSGTALAGSSESGTSYHLEGLYKAKISDNILVTPGLIVIFNPENNNSNNTEYVGTLRTTFTF